MLRPATPIDWAGDPLTYRGEPIEVEKFIEMRGTLHPHSLPRSPRNVYMIEFESEETGTTARGQRAGMGGHVSAWLISVLVVFRAGAGARRAHLPGDARPLRRVH